MKEIVYYIRRKQEPLIAQVTEAAIAGLKNVGVDFEIKYEEEYEPSKIAVLFGYYKNVSSNGRTRKIIYDTQKELGNKILVLERGFLKRDEYHSAGWNGINGRADFNNKNSPSDRFDKLHIGIKPWKEKGSTLIVCGQVPWDSAVQHINPPNSGKGVNAVMGYLTWLSNLINGLRKYENRWEIVFRPHPLFGRKHYYEEVLPEVRWSEQSLEEDLEDAWACLAFNSNTVVEAMIAGVHGFTFDEGAVSYPYTDHRTKLLKRPYLCDRKAFLSNLAYAQWNLNEISLGLFWEHLNGKK